MGYDQGQDCSDFKVGKEESPSFGPGGLGIAGVQMCSGVGQMCAMNAHSHWGQCALKSQYLTPAGPGELSLGLGRRAVEEPFRPGRGSLLSVSPASERTFPAIGFLLPSRRSLLTNLSIWGKLSVRNFRSNWPGQNGLFEKGKSRGLERPNNGPLVLLRRGPPGRPGPGPPQRAD